MKTQMKTTKRFSVILSLTLLTAVFVIAGCGKSQGQNNDTSATAAAVEQDDDPPIIAAIKNEDLKAVKNLLDNDKSFLNYKDSNGLSLLHYAAAVNKNTDILKLLLDSGLDVDIKDSSGETPVFVTLNVSTAEFLLENGANYRVVSKDGVTPLHQAAFLGNVELVNLWLGLGLDIRADSKRLGSPLLAAIRGYAKCDFIKFLISKGARVVSTGCLDPVELWAVYRSDIETLDLLIQNGIKIKDDIIFQTVENPNAVKVLKIFESKGMNINQNDENNGTNLLHKACDFGNTDLIKYLVKNGIDINAKAKKQWGFVPLHFAASSPKTGTDVIEFLLKLGADPTIKSNDVTNC
ncbi:MAG: ankyrin repeat domain-containing protein [Planctomycetaceae bacterium]|jgi:ankyrin repeat protein|nr:ankyrin repeat domain-containing protein [Planctomycetaceae bacterium]